MRPDAAIAAALAARAERSSFGWSRWLGWVLIFMALATALGPGPTLPSHVGLSVRSGPGPESQRPSPLAPRGDLHGVPAQFRWDPGTAGGPFGVVLLDAGYRELARVDRIGGSALPVDAALGALLAGGGTFHWYVLTTGGERAAASPLETFAVP